MTLHGSATLLALAQPCTSPRAGAGCWWEVWHFKALSYGPASALHMGPNSPRGSLAPSVGAKSSLGKAPGKGTDIGLLPSVREMPQLNGALETDTA